MAKERHWGSRWPLTATFATATTIATTASASLLHTTTTTATFAYATSHLLHLSCSIPVCYLLPSITVLYAVNAPGLTVLVLSPP